MDTGNIFALGMLAGAGLVFALYGLLRFCMWVNALNDFKNRIQSELKVMTNNLRYANEKMEKELAIGMEISRTAVCHSTQENGSSQALRLTGIATRLK